MNTTEAAHLARSLMNQHGLGHIPFEFDRAVKRIGGCHFQITRTLGTNGIEESSKVKKITLSGKFVPNLTVEQVRQATLHEIAHAIAGHRANHGPAFRSVARSIGCNTLRCMTLEAGQAPAAKWQSECPSCKTRGATRHRRPARNRIFTCVPCKRVGIVSAVRWVPAKA